jgi:hypothetical protein
MNACYDALDRALFRVITLIWQDDRLGEVDNDGSHHTYIEGTNFAAAA